MVKRYLRVVHQVNQYEDQITPLSDQEIRDRTESFRKKITDGAKPVDILPEVFAVAREAMDRNVGIRNIFNPDENFDPSMLPADARALYDQVKAEMDATDPAEPVDVFQGSEKPVPSWLFVDIPARLYEAVRELHPESKPPFRARPFDVQIIGAVVLYEGHVAEMKTGEGKTIVAPLATYLASLDGKQIHVVTVNDYLVQRDRDWVFPFFLSLGLRAGAIHPQHMQDHEQKKQAYACDVVYGTTAEFGFDYLRDNMKLSAADHLRARTRSFAPVRACRQACAAPRGTAERLGPRRPEGAVLPGRGFGSRGRHPQRPRQVIDPRAQGADGGGPGATAPTRGRARPGDAVLRG
jgi:preprotein translocase subunit SecA